MLHLYAVHEDVPFTRAMTKDVHDEVEALASWLDLTDVRGEAPGPQRLGSAEGTPAAVKSSPLNRSGSPVIRCRA